jgi:hypothetical protein
MPGLNVTLQIDKAQYNAIRSRLGNLQKEAPRAVSTAINKTLPSVRTSIKNIVATELLLPKNEILHTMKVIKATRSNLSGRIYVHRKKISLMRFKPVQTPTGVEVRMRASGTTVIPHAFIATMPSGHQGVFVRAQNGRREVRVKDGKKYTTQLPIKELPAPTVVQILTEHPATLDAIREEAQAKLNRNLESQVDWLIAKGRNKDE